MGAVIIRGSGGGEIDMQHPVVTVSGITESEKEFIIPVDLSQCGLVYIHQLHSSTDDTRNPCGYCPVTPNGASIRLGSRGSNGTFGYRLYTVYPDRIVVGALNRSPESVQKFSPDRIIGYAIS